MKNKFKITQSSFFNPVNKNGEETFDLVMLLTNKNLIIYLTIQELEELKTTIDIFLRKKYADINT